MIRSDHMSIKEAFLRYWEEIKPYPDSKDLGMGMPTASLFPSALEFQEALVQGIKHRAEYQPQAGLWNVREKIAKYEAMRTGLPYTPEHVMTVSGAIRGFSLTIEALIHKDSTLVEIVPTYPLMAGYARDAAKKVCCGLSTIMPKDTINFRVTEDEIFPFIHRSTILYLAEPNNPTGLYLSSQIFTDVVQACERIGAFMIVDESCDLPFSNERDKNHRVLSPSLIRIIGFSKNALLAGYRIAYIVADPDIIRVLSELYAFSDANAPVVANDALLSYLERPEIVPLVSRVSRNMVNSAIEVLRRFPKVEHIIEPEACYYAFVKINYDRGSWQLFRHFLQAGVNVVPGTLFGINDRESWIRICCARGEKELHDALGLLRIALESLQP